MTASDVIKKLSVELGKPISFSRLYRYEERGIVPPPMRDKEGRKVYSQACYDRLLKTIVLSELGFFTAHIRAYNLGNSPELTTAVKDRVDELITIIGKAKTITW